MGTVRPREAHGTGAVGFRLYGPYSIGQGCRARARAFVSGARIETDLVGHGGDAPIALQASSPSLDLPPEGRPKIVRYLRFPTVETITGLAPRIVENMRSNINSAGAST